jgi:hypothetical protein
VEDQTLETCAKNSFLFPRKEIWERDAIIMGMQLVVAEDHFINGESGPGDGFIPEGSNRICMLCTPLCWQVAVCIQICEISSQISALLTWIATAYTSADQLLDIRVSITTFFSRE